MGGKKIIKDDAIKLSKKDNKKVTKLTSQVPYHEGRGEKEEVEKIKQQIEAIWQRTREESWA